MSEKIELQKMLLEATSWTENQKSEINAVLNEIAKVDLDDSNLIPLIEGLDQSDISVIYAQAIKTLKEK